MGDAKVNSTVDRGDEAGLARQARPLWLGGLAAGVGLLALGVGLGWSQRRAIADTMIAAQMESLHLPAHYRVVELTATRAVLADVVVGAAAHPDLTARRVEVALGWHSWLPGVAGVRVEQARLYGRLSGGGLSFGVLDRLWQGPSSGALRLPDMDLALVDARVRVTGEAGPVGLAITGQGGLRDGFVARVGLAAPDLRHGDCRGRAGFGGMLTIADEVPRLEGSAHLSDMVCGGVHVARGTVGVKARGTARLDGGEADLALGTGAVHFAGGEVGALEGPVRLGWRDGAANAVWKLGLRQVVLPGVVADRLGLEGRLRAPGGLASGGLASGGFARVDGEGLVSGAGVMPDRASYGALARAEAAAGGTLGAPVMARIAAALRRETPGSVLDGGFTFHAARGGFSAVAPALRLRGGSKLALIEVQRLTLLAGPDGVKLSGTIKSGGRDLPQVSGAIVGDGKALRLSMAEYRAGDARLAVPDLLVSRAGAGLRWQGRAVLSGGVAPGVSVGDLALPLQGMAGAKGLALWQGCAPVRFGRVSASGLELAAGGVTVCPVGGAVLAGGRIGARVSGVDLAGRLGDSPLRLGAGEVVLNGSDLAARGLAVKLGEAGQLRLENVSADLRAMAGRFAGMTGGLGAVPADLSQGAGQWRYAGGALTLSDVALRVADRETLARFAPLVARGGALTLAGGVVRAQAVLREPMSDREVVRLGLVHELSNARGHVDMAVEGLTFDAGLQPDRLTPLALGSVADAKGRIEGSGRIDWADGKVSSRGKVSTQGFDFAGMAGPVKGVAGTVEFTDLLGLVTAPHQTLKIGSINPGIEATDGVVRFAMEPGYVLSVEDARWPFLDGHMEMAPTRMQLGGAVARRFELRLSGVNAAQLITHMDVSNLAVTGLFDGHVPLVFDQNGGRVAGGELVSRAPGGSVSYVGELSYRDLSAMANYAFRALRSLKFSSMRIGLDGDLAGEVVTKVSMQGLSQGKGASKNFLTRQIAKIPIQFNVSIRAPFYQLIGSMRSLYDTQYVGDPREKGLTLGEPAGGAPANTTNGIQTSASEHRP